MKEQNKILNGILTSAVILPFLVVFPVWGAQNEPARPAVRSEAILMDQIGAVAGRQYSGDGLAVTATAEGARLSCVFQKLEGEATREGLWLISTVNNTNADRFRLKAVAVGREAAGQIFNHQPPTSNLQLEAIGSISVDGQSVRFTRPGLVEEYSVSLAGVRQDFVVTQRPGGVGELRVRLDVTGARVEPAAGGAQLVLEKSGRKIAYGRLRVTDASGRELPARMEVMSSGDQMNSLKPNTERGTQDVEMSRSLLMSSLTGRALAVVVNDADAVYPVRIDPTFSDANWISLGGIPGADEHVYATAMDSSGNLYIGGSFALVGDTNAMNIAKWNGSRWSALGSGVDGPVLALAASGTTVYAAGDFTTAGGNAASHIAKWDGSSWSALGSGMGGYNADVHALAVSGSTVYAGGAFTNAGGNAAGHIAKWNGSSWSALGSGMNSGVYALAVSGSTVYAGGTFTNAGGGAANYIAKWNGSSWSALGSGMNSYVYALAVSGSDLYVGGYFTTAGGSAANYIAKWNGSAWSALGSGTGGYYPQVYALAVSGSTVYAGGYFTTAGGSVASSVAKWNGSSWSALGSGMNSYVYALAVSGTNIYAGGEFTSAGSSAANYVAKWNGTGWSALGSGMMGTGGYYPIVNALAVSGSNVYAGGGFTNAGGSAANFIAKWDGNSWSALGSGMNSVVNALAVSGSNVYAGGWFTNAGGSEANCIAKWDGNSWSALGSGMLGSGDMPEVDALAVSGSDVYAGGYFTTAGGNPANGIAKWDGNGWSALGSGIGGNYFNVYALAVSGSDVYAGGSFSTQIGSPANYIAKWDGSNWSGLGSWMNGSVYALVVSGSNVYVGGHFTLAGGSPANYIAKWDGSSWSALGSGMNYYVEALAVSGSDLYAGGLFTTAGGKVSGYAAKAASVISVPLVIVTTDGLFGFTNRQFRFSLTGPAGSNAVIQAGTNLQTWIPLQTNPLIGGTLVFTDTKATNYSLRFYRAMLRP